VLRHLNSVYANTHVWLTYGQFRSSMNGVLGFNKAIPREVVKNNRFRYHENQPSHLRTFYARLFKNIKKEDLLYQGDFFKMTYDLAIMIPMLEMAGSHHQFIPDVLYIYNEDNPISDHRVDRDLQRLLDRFIRDMEPYQLLEKLFQTRTRG